MATLGYSASLPEPMMGELLDVVHQAIQLPLCIDLGLASEREAIQPLVMTQVRKDGFNDGDTSSV